MNVKSNLRYSTTARVLHWLIAGLIMAQYGLAQLAKQAADQGGDLRQLALLANHKSLGLTVFALVLVRVIWRISHQPPPASITGWQHRASQVAHSFIYCLIIAIPLSGWVMASASAYGISWFNLFEVPAIAADSLVLEERAINVHELLTNILFFVVVLHILAALAHRFFWRDDVLARMASAKMLVLFGITTALTSIGLSQLSTPASDSSHAEVLAQRDDPIPLVMNDTLTVPSALEKWQIDYAQSYIRFSGDQAGAAFDGSWPAWNAELYFDAATQQVSFDVRIDVTQPETSDDERDTTMLDAEWFDAARFPSARFQLTQFERDGNQLTGVGLVQIKDMVVQVPFTFTVDTANQQHTLVGSARLDRLALRLGLGEWTDTTWVGQYVDVNVRVIASTP